MHINFENLLIVTIFFRIIYYLRIWNECLLLWLMICEVCKEIAGFLVYLFLWITLFAVLFMNTLADISKEQKEDEYKNLGMFN